MDETMDDCQVDAPLVKNLDDLAVLYTSFKVSDGGEQQEILYAMFAVFTEDYTAYFGRSPSIGLTLAIVNKSLKQIPDDDIYPQAPSHFTTTTDASNSIYFKRPSLSFYDEVEGSGLLAKMFLQEAEVLEILMGKPHPNIIKYHGCQVYRNHIVGLALERHPYTLQDRIRNSSHNLDFEAGLRDIKSAVQHLHSLSLAHNDISGSSIMVSVENKWILGDFGSCRQIGEEITMGDNPEWTVSSKENDDISLRNLRDWLRAYQSGFTW